MLKNFDLRVGNYILSGNVARVVSIGNKSQEFEQIELETEEDFTWGFRDSYEGLPLTKKLLEKCGFKKEGDWAVLYFEPRMGIRFYNFNSAECDLIQDDKFIGFKNSHIQYLHQLQNLHFALTNTELNVKLF